MEAAALFRSGVAGHRGGPLLDAEGWVIGVVLAKSPSENLNVAVPIAELRDASKSMGEIDQRATFGLPIMACSYAGQWLVQIPLPTTLPDFYAKWKGSSDSFQWKQLQGLLQQGKASRFPNGHGSLQVLYALAINGRMPAAMRMGQLGRWTFARGKTHRQMLPDNGYLETFDSSKGVISRCTCIDQTIWKGICMGPLTCWPG